MQGNVPPALWAARSNRRARCHTGHALQYCCHCAGLGWPCPPSPRACNVCRCLPRTHSPCSLHTTRRYDSVADLGSPEEAADRLKQQVRGQTKSRQCLCPPVAWRWLPLLQACSCSAAAGTYGHLAAVRAGEVQRPFLLCMRHCAPAPHQRLQFQRACSPDPPHVLCSPWRSLRALFQLACSPDPARFMQSTTLYAVPGGVSEHFFS